MHPNLKVINVYAQPEVKYQVINKLIATIEKIQKIEPGMEFIVAGDFNLELT